MRYNNRPERRWKTSKLKPKTHEDLVTHFQKRCLERIGIILNQSVLKDLKRDNRLQVLEKVSNNRTKYLLPKIQYNGKQMLQFDCIVIYDHSRHAFVTVYKFDYEKLYSKDLA